MSQDIKAREAYLRQQRDHLIKMKNKARAERFDSSSKHSSSTKATSQLATEQPPKKVHAKRDTQDDTTTSGGTRRRHSDMNNTGVLCSAIAGKLRKEQN